MTATCPFCGLEVDYVENVQESLCTYQLTRDGSYSRVDEIETADGRNDYVLPCCGMEVDGEEEALAILRGEPYPVDKKEESK